MAGTKPGGIKARDTNYDRHGLNFYRDIGSIGGKNGRTGGFFANRELARLAGQKGGRISRRGRAVYNGNIRSDDVQNTKPEEARREAPNY